MKRNYVPYWFFHINNTQCSYNGIFYKVYERKMLLVKTWDAISKVGNTIEAKGNF